MLEKITRAALVMCIGILSLIFVMEFSSTARAKITGWSEATMTILFDNLDPGQTGTPTIAWWVRSNALSLNNLIATAAPDADNDTSEGYSINSVWIDVTNDEVYFCVDATDAAAVWSQGGGGGDSLSTEEAALILALDLDDDGIPDYLDPKTSAPGTPTNGQLAVSDGDNWQTNGTGQGTNDVLSRYRSSDTTWVPIFDITTGSIIEKARSLAIADLNDTTSPHTLTASETSDTIISNYNSTTQADCQFQFPAAHIGGAVIFPIGSAFQVDLIPFAGANFVLNGTPMASNEEIQNTADTLYQRIVCYVVNIQGTLTWTCNSNDTDFVEETP